MTIKLVKPFKVLTPNLIVVLLSLTVYLGGGLVWAAPPGSPWGADYFPNVELTNQDGEKLHFYDDLIKDKLFVISFIYTRCTDSCPLETATLRNLQKALGDKMGKEVVLYSISIDGDRDDPAALKSYAAKFHAGPGWTFLSGRPEDVKLLRQKLGLYRDDGKQEQLNEHGISILMGNERSGQFIKRSPFEETSALVRILTKRLQNSGAASNSKLVLPRAAAQSPGETLFRSNCEACHSLDSEEGIGPGLAGVLQRREPNWLKRWIKEPDRMVAEQDPIALALYQQYKEVPMPNYRLSDSEVENLLKYLQEVGTKP